MICVLRVLRRSDPPKIGGKGGFWRCGDWHFLFLEIGDFCFYFWRFGDEAILGDWRLTFSYFWRLEIPDFIFGDLEIFQPLFLEIVKIVFFLIFL